MARRMHFTPSAERQTRAAEVAMSTTVEETHEQKIVGRKYACRERTQNSISAFEQNATPCASMTKIFSTIRESRLLLRRSNSIEGRKRMNRLAPPSAYFEMSPFS
jgi:hypothetical protein